MKKSSSFGPWLVGGLVGVLIGAGGLYLWQSNMGFGSFLVENEMSFWPSGAAEVEGYITTVERSTTLDDSGESEVCSALVITGGPKKLIAAMESQPAMFGNASTVVAGEMQSLSYLPQGSKENPERYLVTLNPIFEGEAVGCMSIWFNSVQAVE